MDISDNIAKINDKIKSAASQAGRSLEDIKLIAVSKKKSTDLITAAHHCGLTNFGENYLQESVEKISSINSKEIDWHFIGNIQSKKSSQIAQYFSWVHTIDREKIVLKIKDLLNSEYHARSYKFFIQVNIGNEEQKSGVKISDLSDFIEWTVKDQNLKVDGLMCIPPYDEDPSLYFNLLRQLCDNHNLQHASMGMTNDFEKAVKFGATYLRVGSGIFGKRS